MNIGIMYIPILQWTWGWKNIIVLEYGYDSDDELFFFENEYNIIKLNHFIGLYFCKKILIRSFYCLNQLLILKILLQLGHFC